ncbi:unnamed protein product [Cuscuta campestris]|uniref:Glycosyltransferase 2-like domain-containing protein n=1 Tax=Cuscuta campestris TaxID=132261 RepID=A0A484KFT5_9ASTE|nr:unnamed protein product [Cuscuta campestris]
MAAYATPSAAAAVPPLNVLRPLTANLIINRLHMLLNGIAITAIFSYRLATISGITKEKRETPRLLPHLVVLVSEAILTFLWILHQAPRWRPVKRAVFPERLPEDEGQLPAVDVFVCTADPSKEPPLGVMNTVLSAMSLDYPSRKLSVYVSDDGGSSVTLNAVREAWRFSRFWVPFCRKYEVEVRCPEGYFSDHGSLGGSEDDDDDEYVADRKIIKERYSEFKDALYKNSVNASKSVSRDHPPTVEVMTDENEDSSGLREMPLLVYVAREKRRGHPHHFKGGAVNVLLRVSAVISNAPYFLVLDCDMYCNDPSSARQAMCFYLDPKVSSQIAWVQFPQQFHNATERDLYDGRLNPYLREGQGFDGLRGPVLYGCNFFMKREAIHGAKNIRMGDGLNELKELFGSSNEFIEAARHKNCYKPKLAEDRKPSGALQKELQLLASSTYDAGTQWGKQVGFRYGTVVEDGLTSLQLHCNGWVSVAVDDPDRRPCFLGTSTTNLNDMLVQQMRWSFGLMQIGLSRFTPLIYGPLRMSVLQSMCYGALVFKSLYTFPFYGLSIIPPICLLYGIPLYPNVSDPFFFAFAYVFVASHLKHVQEVYAYGDRSLGNAVYEVRVWMMKSGTGYLYALVNSVLDKFGMHETNFNVTNKAGADDEQAMLYERGMYDFRASPVLLVPLCSIYILNLACSVLGMWRMFRNGGAGSLLAQAALSFYGVVVNCHLLEGMFLRKDSGRISGYVSQIAIMASGVVFGCGSLLVHCC